MREDGKRAICMESASGTVLPDLLQRSLSLEKDFCQALHSSGRTVTALRPPYVDPLVITQKWLIAPDGTPFDAQAFYHAFECACHGVETQEMTIRGDADVLALKESQLILVECKSSPDISEQKLRNLLQRVTDV